MPSVAQSAEMSCSTLCVCLLVVLAVAAVLGAPPSKYTTKFDSINVDQILQNERLLKSYFNCLMERGKCTPDGEELKKLLPDAVETGCTKCSQRQKEGSEKVLRFLIDQRPKLFDELETKYDSKGVYRARYRAQAAAHGIKV